LRSDGLVALEHKTLTIPSFERLKAYAGFEANYLHRVTRRAVQAA
jgi:hypothetical protein